MSASTTVSKGVTVFVFGMLASTVAPLVGCSAQVRSCDETEPCAKPHAEAGEEAAGESGSSSGGTTGASAPMVKCGRVDCLTDTKVCCFRRSGNTTSQTCDRVADCKETPFDAEPARTPTECDEHSDCPPGYLCSVIAASGGSHVYCRLAAEANASSPTANSHEVCESPMTKNACSGGSVCTGIADAFPGWKFCAQH